MTDFQLEPNIGGGVRRLRAGDGITLEEEDKAVKISSTGGSSDGPMWERFGSVQIGFDGGPDTGFPLVDTFVVPLGVPELWHTGEMGSISTFYVAGAEEWFNSDFSIDSSDPNAAYQGNPNFDVAPGYALMVPPGLWAVHASVVMRNDGSLPSDGVNPNLFFDQPVFDADFEYTDRTFDRAYYYDGYYSAKWRMMPSSSTQAGDTIETSVNGYGVLINDTDEAQPFCLFLQPNAVQNPVVNPRVMSWYVEFSDNGDQTLDGLVAHVATLVDTGGSDPLAGYYDIQSDRVVFKWPDGSQIVLFNNGAAVLYNEEQNALLQLSGNGQAELQGLGILLQGGAATNVTVQGALIDLEATDGGSLQVDGDAELKGADVKVQTNEGSLQSQLHLFQPEAILQADQHVEIMLIDGSSYLDFDNGDVSLHTDGFVHVDGYNGDSALQLLSGAGHLFADELHIRDNDSVAQVTLVNGQATVKSYRPAAADSQVYVTSEAVAGHDSHVDMYAGGPAADHATVQVEAVGGGTGQVVIASNASGTNVVTVEVAGIDWQFRSDGFFSMPSGPKMCGVAGVPDNANGANGDWCLSKNGHIYFKTGGAWAEKV